MAPTHIVIICFLTVSVYVTCATPFPSQAEDSSSSDRSLKSSSITENLQKFKDLVLERFEQIRQGRAVKSRQANKTETADNEVKPGRTRNSKIMRFDEVTSTTTTQAPTSEGPKEEVEIINEENVNGGVEEEEEKMTNDEEPEPQEEEKEEEVEEEKKQPEVKNHRNQKNYNYFPFYQRPYYNFDYSPPNLNYYYTPPKDYSTSYLQEEWLGRTEPFKRKNQQQLIDSPIYYVRLPPTPYVYVPGIGYVSRPPSLNEPEVLNNVPDSTLPEDKPDNKPEHDLPSSPFIHLPIDFISNGKPTSVYQLPNEPKPIIPKPEISLDKGPYLFNGRPIDIYILRNSYNSLYADALTNFYP